MIKQVIAYGSAAEQFIEWYAIDSDLSPRPKGVVVLVHGGFWRQQHRLDQMHPLATYFIKQGWAVANIEYRRSGCGGDWPIIIEDVKAAFDCVLQQAAKAGIMGPVVGIGHSVGGQLVLLAAEKQDLVVALAPVSDVHRTDQEQLGENAAWDFFGTVSTEIDQQASPIHQLPLATEVLLVHGVDDQRVPLAHSIDFVQKFTQQDGLIDFWEIDGLDHFYIIDPNCEIWPNVTKKMNSICH